MQGFNHWQKLCVLRPVPIAATCVCISPQAGGLAWERSPPAGLIIELRVIFVNMTQLPKKAGDNRALGAGLMPSNRGRFTETEMACSVLEGQLARLVNIT